MNIPANVSGGAGVGVAAATGTGGCSFPVASFCPGTGAGVDAGPGPDDEPSFGLEVSFTP